VDVEDVLYREEGAEQVAGGAVDYALGFAGGAGGLAE